MTPTCRSRRPGFTLLEMVGVLCGLGACLAVGGALIVTAMKSEKLGDAAANRIAGRVGLASQFRADVARAESAPDRADDLAAGPACLILRLPGGAEVVYRWDGERLERLEQAGGHKGRRVLPVGPAGTHVELVRSAAKPPVVTLRIIEPAGHAPEKRMEVSAVMGGDLR